MYFGLLESNYRKKTRCNRETVWALTPVAPGFRSAIITGIGIFLFDDISVQKSENNQTEHAQQIYPQ
jgi:hypothetical protein